MRGRPLSVRWRATLLATVLVAAALAMAASALVVLLGRSLTSSDDDLSRSRLDDLAAQARSGELPRVLPAIGDDSVAQVLGPDDEVVASSSNIVGASRFAFFAPTGGGQEERTVPGPDDAEQEIYRLWATRASTPNGPVTIYVGTTRESVREVTSRLTRLLLWGVPVVVALLGVATWLVVGRALRPVDRMRAEVAEISERALDRRVPQPGTRDELQRLAETMNSMLDRLESASVGQREFVANASHDLQSPLTVVRAELDVATRHPEATDWPELVATVRAETDRMERLVQDLLYLARAEGTRPGPGRLVDLDVVALEEVARIQPSCGIEVDARHVSGAPVRGSADDFSRLVRNLLSNACMHAASRVTITTTRQDDSVLLVVADDGPGIPETERDKVFERFFRGDASRSTEGTGLGLAIVRSVAERNGGTVRVADAGPGARFVVRLPAG